MEPIAQRLKTFLQHKGLNTTAFCRVMQYRSCEKIARLFRLEGAKPSVDILEDITRYFPELNLRWLLTGVGEMLPDEGDTPPVFVDEARETPLMAETSVARTHQPYQLEPSATDAFFKN